MTYTYHGLAGRLTLTKEITKHNYIVLCNLLSIKLSELYNEKVMVIPEAITEGGLLILTKDFINTGKYKTFRHNFINNMRINYKWPRININEYQDWYHNNEILIPKILVGEVCLKAFYGAQLWTVEELKIFKTCFRQFGIKYVGMPSTNEELKRDDDHYLNYLITDEKKNIHKYCLASNTRYYIYEQLLGTTYLSTKN